MSAIIPITICPVRPSRASPTLSAPERRTYEDRGTRKSADFFRRGRSEWETKVSAGYILLLVKTSDEKLLAWHFPPPSPEFGKKK